MTKARKIVLAIALFCILCAVLVLFVFVSLHGYFDRGQFEIEKAEWVSSTQVAVVAKRSDHEALSGDQYFVVIGDHLFSSPELRHAYYAHGVIFRAGSSCLTVRWENPHHLIVTCEDRSIEPDQIAVQQHQSGDIAISYVDIPNKN